MLTAAVSSQKESGKEESSVFLVCSYACLLGSGLIWNYPALVITVFFSSTILGDQWHRCQNVNSLYVATVVNGKEFSVVFGGGSGVSGSVIFMKLGNSGWKDSATPLRCWTRV